MNPDWHPFLTEEVFWLIWRWPIAIALILALVIALLAWQMTRGARLPDRGGDPHDSGR